MSMETTLHDVISAEHRNLSSVANDALAFKDVGRNEVILFIPPHVAAATAKAFNRAMQVKREPNGLVYATDAGIWHINNPMPKFWTAQHDEVTGDGDPSWMFAEAGSLEALQDVIDDIEDECTCTGCKALVGEDGLTEISRDEYLCGDCLEEASKRAAELAEAAGDDKAHAARERAQEATA